MHVGLAEGHVGLVAMTTALDMEREAQELALSILKRMENRQIEDPHVRMFTYYV
jgi:hypothetical protein